MSVSIDPSLLSQIHLSGETSCPQFTPHILKANFCTDCSKLVNKHAPSAIPNDQCLLKVGKGSFIYNDSCFVFYIILGVGILPKG